MKEYTFSNKSWHFKLANVGVQRVWDFEQIDICSYIRKVLAGAIVFSVMVAGFSFIVWVFGFGYITLGIWLFDCFSTGVVTAPNPIAGLVGLGTLLVLFAYIVIGIKSLLNKAIDKFVDYTLKDWQPQVVKEKEPSFITLAYRKFKDKTCFRVNFK